MQWIFDLILCYKYLHGLVETNNCNFIRIHQSSRTRGNGMKLYKEQCSNERDINSSLIVLLIYGTLYPQQSFLPQVWLFLNEIQPSWRPVAFYVTLNNTCLCILCHVFYCDVSGCLVLLLLINWLIDWIDWLIDWLVCDDTYARAGCTWGRAVPSAVLPCRRPNS